VCINGDGGYGHSSFIGQEEHCLRRLIREGTSTHRSLDIVPPHAKISRQDSRPDITCFIAGVQWCSRPNAAPSSLVLRVQRHIDRLAASDNTASARNVVHVACERQRGAGEGNVPQSPTPCRKSVSSVGQFEKSARPEREKELSLFVSSEASASNPSHHRSLRIDSQFRQ
jgi:hypothetical protein